MAKLAINGGKPTISGGFPVWPIYTKEDKKILIEVLESRKWCRGPVGEKSKCEQFEKAFAKYHDAKFGILTANGTISIQLALRTLGVEIGDEIIVPAVTFIATASAVAEIGAIPVFADIDPDTACIDWKSVKQNITNRTKGIIGVHYGGYPIDFDALLPLCKKYNLFIIEDAAPAHGTEWKGRKIGAIGDMGSFSFQESKSLTAGEGGIVLTDNKELAERCKVIHNIGRKVGQLGYPHTILSSNYRLSEFQGGLLLSQLSRLNRQTEIKYKNSIFLKKEMKSLGLIPLKEDSRITKLGYYFLVLKYQKKIFNNIPRDRFLDTLKAEGMPAYKGYDVPLYKNPCFRKEMIRKLLPGKIGKIPDYEKLNLPVSEIFCAEEQIVIPQYVLLSPRVKLQGVIDAVSKIKENISELHKVRV